MAANKVVTTPLGKLEGEQHRRLQIFRGIPFARPPLGDLRFRAPEPAAPWRGLRPALRFGPASPQSAPVMLLVRRMIGSAERSQSQDCLYLNVWTPAADGRRRPVLVWIHGGAFVMGSGATTLYHGSRLARRGDVVVVTLNYRLGALGFLNHPELRASGVPANLGLRDQIAALEWVRGNIEAFGGDPERVTVFGESAGAMSIGALLAAPSARGLFQRAILQSGAAHNVSSEQRASDVAELLLSKLGLFPGDGEALRGASVSRLMQAQREATVEAGLRDGHLAWQPSVDGDLLPVRPLDAIQTGSTLQVPLLVGTNRDEWKLFMIGDVRGRRLDEAGLARRLSRVLPVAADGGRPPAELAQELYRSRPRGRTSPGEAWVAFQSDRVFLMPALRLAELWCRRTPATYSYLFTWSPPLLGRALGSCHGLELPFVFGTLRDALLRPVIGATRAALALSLHMQDAWIAFAREGEPGHDALPAWRAYEPEKRTSMVLGPECVTEGALFEEERRFWETRL